MNRNHLKIIACVSMLADHMCLLLFPQLIFLRWCGRLAMPLFAFFIGEGCRYTRNRKKYFLSVFLLGAGCQLVYIIDELIVNGQLGFASDAWYLNILLTFSVSIPLGYCLCDLKTAMARKNRADTKKYALLFGAGLITLAAGEILLRQLRGMGCSLRFDYGIWGVLLPLSTLVFDARLPKLAAFTGITLLFCAFTAPAMPFVWFSLLACALLLLYNGQSGSRSFKYGFYIFYPAHLAALYLISQFV